jgi:hypothetical protein
MSLPKTITEPPTPLQPAHLPARDEPTWRRPTAPFRVALVRGSAPQSASELESQLRKRLRFCALVAVVYCATTIGIYLPFTFPRLAAAPLEAFTRSPCLGILLLVASLNKAPQRGKRSLCCL